VDLEDLSGIAVRDTWTDIEPINSAASKSLGYPTRKPQALLERVIEAGSKPGDLVPDPFCGCGTTVHAAQKLGRQWIGIDDLTQHQPHQTPPQGCSTKCFRTRGFPSAVVELT
jgi:hypothetical protein